MTPKTTVLLTPSRGTRAKGPAKNGGKGRQRACQCCEADFWSAEGDDRYCVPCREAVLDELRIVGYLQPIVRVPTCHGRPPMKTRGVWVQPPRMDSEAPRLQALANADYDLASEADALLADFLEAQAELKDTLRREPRPTGGEIAALRGRLESLAGHRSEVLARLRMTRELIDAGSAVA